ncbi:hypothetical protein C8R46DRAFT_447634 [Mycena filopes]|nr:hypothetical protein C8R46DRAFT_447634 [Mycena filopes]
MDFSTVSSEGAEHFEDGEYLEDDTCAYSSGDDEEPEKPDFASKNPSLAPLVTSNDAPQTAQLAILREIRREHEVAILKVATDIADVESTLKALEARRVALLREKRMLRLVQDQCLGLMSPIRRLPPEILGEIFLYFTPVLCADLRRSSRFDPRPSEVPWYLGQVCQYWRRVAVSLRPLWSVFDFCPGRRFQALKSTKPDFGWVLDVAEAAQKEREAQPHMDKDKPPWSPSDMEDHFTFMDQVEDPDKHARLNRSIASWHQLSPAIKAEERRREQALALCSLDLSLRRTQGPFASRFICPDSSSRAVGSLGSVLEGVLQYSHRLNHLVFLDAPAGLLDIFSWSSGSCPQLRTLELAFTTVTALRPTFVWPPSLTELVLTKVDLYDSQAEDIPWVQLLKYHQTDCRWSWAAWRSERRSAAFQRLTSVVDLCIDSKPFKSIEEALMDFRAQDEYLKFEFLVLQDDSPIWDNVDEMTWSAVTEGENIYA